MADDVDLRQEILQRTLQEVAHEELESVANPCVICLDSITEPGVAVPCNHANFDFLCLVSWLEQRPNCPLCKSELTAVQYDLKSPQGPKVYKLPPRSTNRPPSGSATQPRPPFRRGARPSRRVHPNLQPPRPDDPLLRRRNVYRNQLYSLRVGSNRLSQYRELTPDLFNRDEALVSRARKWIRRELRVFSFLNPETEEEEQRQGQVSRPGQQRLENRRANNAEFLLEYIVAILRTVDMKGSAGQAEELLRDFIGRDNARLFLHELQAWLRSPYISLEDWDRHVQYPSSPPNPLTADRGSLVGCLGGDTGFPPG
ncbi:Zinc finger RING-type [Penicillium lagena]|uniref:Zinc finger RING-type n=1 Tax=Penicillium lagena TaxID=94218 RepID=UPI002540B025|nr:Zinc finger RING-type [Penicillium lagena]KAJ5624115.1 Zinc finger RING-type [Penicillium lagena]